MPNECILMDNLKSYNPCDLKVYVQAILTFVHDALLHRYSPLSIDTYIFKPKKFILQQEDPLG